MDPTSVHTNASSVNRGRRCKPVMEPGPYRHKPFKFDKACRGVRSSTLSGSDVRSQDSRALKDGNKLSAVRDEVRPHTADNCA